MRRWRLALASDAYGEHVSSADRSRRPVGLSATSVFGAFRNLVLEGERVGPRESANSVGPIASHHGTLATPRVANLHRAISALITTGTLASPPGGAEKIESGRSPLRRRGQRMAIDKA